MGGFTLIEVLVVIVVTAVLIAIMVPSLTNARRYAVQVKCSSNMRQIGIGNGSYMTDYKEWMLGFKDPSGVGPLCETSMSNVTKEQWTTYWPVQIRWCPDLATDRDLIDGGPGAWAPAYGVRDNANQNYRTRFGYSMPALSETAVESYGYHTTRMGGATENNWYTRPEKDGLARSFGSNPSVYDGGKTWRYRGSLPYAFDLVWMNSASPTRFVVAHDTDGDPVDSTYRVTPTGGNGLWGDGSVKWFPWVQASAFNGEYRDVAVGAVVSTQKQREDWCRMYSSVNFFFVARRGR